MEISQKSGIHSPLLAQIPSFFRFSWTPSHPHLWNLSGTFMHPFWKGERVCVCVCVCMCVCAHACMHVCVRMCMHVCACMRACLRVCMHACVCVWNTAPSWFFPNFSSHIITNCYKIWLNKVKRSVFLTIWPYFWQCLHGRWSALQVYLSIKAWKNALKISMPTKT